MLNSKRFAELPALTSEHTSSIITGSFFLYLIPLIVRSLTNLKSLEISPMSKSMCFGLVSFTVLTDSEYL